jgi:hypothetical protein
MTEVQTRRWRSRGCSSPASNAGGAADAGSSRIYYERLDDEGWGTGEYCYRPAFWGDHGTGCHDFCCYGDGYGCDERGFDNGRTYPAAEF